MREIYEQNFDHKGINLLFIFSSTNKGYASEKGQSANVEMGDLSSEKGQSRGTTPHYIAPDGSVYASVKGKSEDANGAIDNKNFVADSDGAYEPVNDEAKKKKVKDFEYDSGLDGYVVYDYSTLLSVSAQSNAFDERLDSFCVISRV